MMHSERQWTSAHLKQTNTHIVNQQPLLIMEMHMLIRQSINCPLLPELHWLRVPEWVTFRLCVFAYRCLHGTAPSYLAASFLRTSDVDTRRRLQNSADSATLVVPSTRHTTLGDCAFPVASARAWNSLPSSVRNAPSLMTFRRDLKTVLFRSSFDLH